MTTLLIIYAIGYLLMVGLAVGYAKATGVRYSMIGVLLRALPWPLTFVVTAGKAIGERVAKSEVKE
jgi:hypothetical protein